MIQGKILLVDDSPSTRMLLEDKLGENGYTVCAAENGREALELLQVFTPDVVITDVSMPEMDGFTLCRSLKEDARVKHIPIIMLTAATEEKEVLEGLGLGACDYIRKPFSPDELLLRVHNVLAGVREKTRLQEMFSRHTSPEVMRELLSRPDDLLLSGQLRDVTVLFADIRGFTPIVAMSEPRALVSELNQVLTIMSEAVIAEEGTLDKFLGDGIMAIFGAPLAHPDDCRRAVRAAVEIQRVMARTNAARESKGQRAMTVGIGITAGPAVVGNIGSPRRMDYTAIGDCVNIAARLQAKAFGGQIIVTEEVKTRVERDFDLEPLGDASLKGKADPLRIFAVTY